MLYREEEKAGEKVEKASQRRREKKAGLMEEAQGRDWFFSLFYFSFFLYFFFSLFFLLRSLSH